MQYRKYFVLKDGYIRALFAAGAIIAALRILGACAACANPSTTLKLNTGETLIGEVVARDDDFVEIQNSYANIKVPTCIIVDETTDAPEEVAVVPIDRSGDQFSDSNDANSEEWRPFFGAEKSVIGRNNPIYRGFKEFTDEYRQFLEQILPEGLEMKITAGISNEISTLRKNSYYFSGYATKEWKTMSFSASGFYNYEWQKTFDCVESVVTDKYGANASYKWNFLDSPENNYNSGWYFTTMSSYRHDSIKGIELQVDSSIGLGYDFKIPSIGLEWSVSAGPGGRYLDAADYDRHYIPMLFLSENLTWDITDLLRLEHQGYFGMDLETAKSGTAYVMVGLVFAPKEVVSIALRLTNDFDTINSSLAIKNEQKLILSIEIPLDGKKSDASSGN